MGSLGVTYIAMVANHFKDLHFVGCLLTVLQIEIIVNLFVLMHEIFAIRHQTTNK